MEFIQEHWEFVSMGVAFLASEAIGASRLKANGVTHLSGQLLRWLGKAAWRGIIESIAERKAKPR